MKPKKPQLRNKSPYGWWVYVEVEKWVPNGRKRKKHTVWANTRIIQARNRHEAYRKALRLGNEAHPDVYEDGKWTFVGISLLFPIYEKIEDGTEILWSDYGMMTEESIGRLVKNHTTRGKLR